MVSTECKECSECGSMFYKKARDAKKDWARRVTCSVLCGNRRKARNNTQLIIDRLERYIVRVPEAGCWIWIGTHDGRYYGHLASSQGKAPLKAHRVSYEYYVGPIPEGMVLRHRCDVPACVNPHHLETGTQKDNAADMMKRGRFNKVVLRNLKRESPLDAAQQEQIPRLVEYGISQGEIARMFQVDRKTIFNYSNGRK